MLMHSLIGTFVTELPSETYKDVEYFPIKVMFPLKKMRVIYFDDEDMFKKWMEKLKEATGDCNVTEFYEIKETLGQG